MSLGPEPPPPTLCPNCRQPWQLGQAYCSLCGYRERPSPVSQGARIAMLIVFVIVGLPALGLGGLCTFTALSELASPTSARGNDYAMPILMIGGIVFLIGLSLLIATIRTFRK